MKQRWPAWLGGIIIGLAGLAAYGRSFTVPFFFDDRPGIIDNASIRHLSDLRHVFWAPPEAGGSAGRPLVNASLAVNYALGGLDVTGYHAFNLAVHLLAGCLLFGVIRRTVEARLGDGEQPWTTRRSYWVGFLAALVWTVHPLGSESVVCTIQRNEVMLGAAFLFSLYAFIRGWWVASVVGCLIAIACKEVAAVLPLILLAYDRTFVAGTFRLALRRRAYYLSLAASWIALAFILLGTRQRGDSVGFGLGVSSWDYLLTQCRAICLYLRLCVWPSPLVVDYGNGVVRSLGAVAGRGGLILALLGAGAVAFFSPRKFWQAVGFLVVWFFVILAPSSSVVPLVTQTMAEHRVYLSLAAVVTGGVLILFALAGAIGRPALGTVACLAIAVAAAAATLHRSAELQDEFTLWQRTAADWPDNPRVFMNLGTVSSWRGHQPEAIGYFRHSLALDTQAADTRFNLAVALEKNGDNPGAAEEYRHSIRLDPSLPAVRLEYGRFLAKEADFDGAISEFEAALRLRPESERALSSLAQAHLGAADLLARENRLAEALPHVLSAVTIQPDNPQALNNLGTVQSALGRHAEALAAFARAIRAHPDYVEARYNLAAELADAGRYTEARDQLAEVVRLKPDDPQAREELARVSALAR